MLVRLIKSSPGCTFQPGHLIRIGDRQGQKLIDTGFGERADEAELARPVEVRVPPPEHRARGANPFMLPPRHLCRCGFVAKSPEELARHQCG